MKLSTRTRYGLRAVLEVAISYNKGPIQTKIVSQRQLISIKYLEQLMAALKSGGLIKGIRGSKGGYVLAKAPSQIKLSDVFNVLEGPVKTVECVDNENYCAKTSECVARQVWSEVEEAINAVLQSITLQDLVDRTKKERNLNYQI
jgi:Rrf2 family cysteine metabolism transcriptional repressor